MYVYNTILCYITFYYGIILTYITLFLIQRQYESHSKFDIILFFWLLLSDYFF